MSVTIRPYVDGGWEVDIRISLPDGSVIRERRKAPTASKSAAQRWAEARERVLLVNGKPDRVKEVLRPPTTLREFAPRFLEATRRPIVSKRAAWRRRNASCDCTCCRRSATSRWARSRRRTYNS